MGSTAGREISLVLLIALEAAFMGGAAAAALISGYRILSDDAALARPPDPAAFHQWHSVAFISLLPLALTHGAVLLTLIAALARRSPFWLLPYVLWRPLLSAAVLAGMVAAGLAAHAPAARSAALLAFAPAVASLSLGLWGLLAALRLRSAWTPAAPYARFLRPAPSTRSLPSSTLSTLPAAPPLFPRLVPGWTPDPRPRSPLMRLGTPPQALPTAYYYNCFTAASPQPSPINYKWRPPIAK